MRIVDTSKPLPIDTLGQLAFYSGMDTLCLYEINEGLDSVLTPTKRATYAFELELQAALLEMSLNGIFVDQLKRDELIRQHEEELLRVQTYLHKLCLAIGYYSYYLNLASWRYAEATGLDAATLPRSWSDWLDLPIATRRQYKALDPTATFAYHKALKSFGPPYIPGDKTSGAFNGNSNKQKLTLFYDFFGDPSNSCADPDFPPPWSKTRGITEIRTRDSKGEWTPSTDRESLEKIQQRGYDFDTRDAACLALPFVSCCLDIADYAKSLGFLRCRLERGYFKSSFGAVTETGRLASKENAQGFGSNGQNVSPRLRVILCAEPGLKLGALDYEQIESRNVAAICYRLFGATNYLNAAECGDLHTLVCSMVWSDKGWPAEFSLAYLEKYGPPFPAELVKAAKAIAGQNFYRHFSFRDAVKRLGHGSNYRGQPPHMAKQTHIPFQLVEHFQALYFEHFPELPQWHRWVVEQVQTKGEITTMLGRTRRFFGRPNDDATIREAIAFEPQSIAADYTNRALLALLKKVMYENLPIKLRLQKHDELVFTFQEADEDQVIKQVVETMEQHLTITSPTGVERDWYVPAEAMSGWNLGFFDKKKATDNPDGLRGWPCERTRQGNPTNFLKMRL